VPVDEGAVTGVNSIQRGLAVLAIIMARGAVRVSDVSRALDLAMSTTHRVLASMEAAGFVTRGGSTHVYVPGPRAYQMIGAWEATEDELCAAGQQQLAHLVEEFSETAHIVVLRGDRVRFIAGLESGRALRAGLRLGLSYPAHRTSGGKALLAALPLRALHDLYPDEQLPEATSTSVATFTELLAELDRTRERGWAVNDHENEDSVVGIGAAIIDTAGRARGAVVVGGPSSRVSVDDGDLIGHEVAASARAIGAALTA